MSQTLTIPNFGSLNLKETGQLNLIALTGATSLRLVTTNDFDAGDYLYVGNFSSESSELRTVGVITDETNLTIDALVRDHQRFEPVTSLFGDQVTIYRASNVDGTAPADIDFSVLDTVDLDFDQASTNYTDNDGSDDYWYKFIYWSSGGAIGTDLADATPARGNGATNTAYASIEAIRKEAGISHNRWITDSDVDAKRRAAMATIDSALNGLYTVPFTAPINSLIELICKLLAAGLILTDNYGPVSILNTTNGQSKIEQVTNKEKTGYLDKLISKELRLTDEAGTDTSIPGVNGFSGWPDASTATAATENGGGERKFRTGDRY